MPSDKGSIPPGGATMQLDALVDDLEEVDAPALGAEAMGPPGSMVSAPPPLPPKKAGKAVWIIGVMVVLLATGLGLGVGLFVLSRAPAEAEPAPSATAAAAPEPADEPAAEPAAPAEADENVVALDEFVFDDSTELEEPAPEGEDTPAE